MKWHAPHIGGKEYDLSHLHPFAWDLVVQGKDGKPERRYGIDVTFSLHCFTKGKREAQTPYASELEYSDSRETRLFDNARYELSFQLPHIIRTIDSRPCFRTGHGNFFTIKMQDADGRAVEYTVYFKVSRSSHKGRLNLYVESAYVQNSIPRRKASPRKPIRFYVIAFNVQNNKPIAR